MPNLIKLLKKTKVKKVLKTKSPKLQQNPQKKATCLKVLTLAPKKPNSANRKIAKVKISQSNIFSTIKITGEKHNLQQHSTILVSGGKVKDLIGVKLKAVRGKYDLAGVKNRKTSRSKYGVKKLKV
jgi:small subunit ribosomal protein S12